MLADCADYETTMCEPATTFMSLHASSRWKLRTNNIAAEKKAASLQAAAQKKAAEVTKAADGKASGLSKQADKLSPK